MAATAEHHHEEKQNDAWPVTTSWQNFNVHYVVKDAFDFRIVPIYAWRIIRAIRERPIVELYVEPVFFNERFHTFGKTYRLSRTAIYNPGYVFLLHYGCYLHG